MTVEPCKERCCSSIKCDWIINEDFNRKNTGRIVWIDVEEVAVSFDLQIRRTKFRNQSAVQFSVKLQRRLFEKIVRLCQDWFEDIWKVEDYVVDCAYLSLKYNPV